VPTIVTSRSGAVIDALVTACKLLPVFADPARVYDGPNTAGDTQWTSAVFIGFDGNWHTGPNGEVAFPASYEGVLVNQELPYVGNTTVKETLEVQCVAEAWSGDPNTQTARNATLAMLAGVETVLRTDPTLGIDGSTIATLRVGSLFYAFDAGGNLAVRIPFTVHVLTTISTT
jgi:hypothetical protein